MTCGAPISLSAEEILATARRLTGIDMDDREALEPLGVMVESFNEDSRLHAAGAEGMTGRLVRMACNRLRMKRDYANHPEIADQRLAKPIFLCGMGRTGSTKTQKLLARSGDFNWSSYWMVFNPSLITGSRDESPQPRIDEAQRYLEWADAASPEVKYAHSWELYEPEEDSLILEHSFKSPVMLGWGPLELYLSWLMTQDMAEQLVYLRDTLKYLQWQGLASPDKRWIMKSPLYTGLEAEALQVFPDASIVATHRDPIVAIPSALRLLELFYKPFTFVDIDARRYIVGQAAAIDQHLRNRATIPMCDVSYDELTGPVAPVVEKIYRHCGITLTPESLDRMIAWDNSNPPHKLGRHRYSLADYGLSDADITAAFGEYMALLKRLFG